MVPEAPLVPTEEGGLVPGGHGWFVLNAEERAGVTGTVAPGRCLRGADRVPQTAVVLYVLGPREPIGRYHWEVDREDFVVLAGSGVLLIEGEERPLRQWDFVRFGGWLPG